LTHCDRGETIVRLDFASRPEQRNIPTAFMPVNASAALLVCFFFVLLVIPGLFPVLLFIPALLAQVAPLDSR